MTLRALLRKELRWGRRRLGVLVLVLVVLPALVAASSLVFQDVLPRDAPVAVVAADGADDEDVGLATATLRLFAEPVAYPSTDAALQALDRERVYAVVVVPPGLADDDREVTVDVHVDARIVPYREPSGAIVAATEAVLGRDRGADVSVERHLRGDRIRLSAYLLPTFLFVLLAIVAFAYLPYDLANEAGALDRVRVASSLEAFVAAKLLVLTGLMLVPLMVFAVAARAFDLSVRLLAPGAVAVFLLAFLAMAAASTAVTFTTRFTSTGRLLNVVVMFALLASSGLVYPAGFFSPLRREIVRLVPLHYAVVLVRNATLKGLGPRTYPEAAGIVVATTAGGLVLAEAALAYYRRTSP